MGVLLLVAQKIVLKKKIRLKLKGTQSGWVWVQGENEPSRVYWTPMMLDLSVCIDADGYIRWVPIYLRYVIIVNLNLAVLWMDQLYTLQSKQHSPLLKTISNDQRIYRYPVGQSAGWCNSWSIMTMAKSSLLIHHFYFRSWVWTFFPISILGG